MNLITDALKAIWGRFDRTCDRYPALELALISLTSVLIAAYVWAKWIWPLVRTGAPQ